MQNPEFPQNESLNREQEKKRITVLSDTHDASIIAERVKRMYEVGGDINVTVGDAFDSEIRGKLLDEYKENNQKAIEGLSSEEKEIFDRLVSTGNVPVRAYWLSRVQVHPELLQDIRIELDDAYELFTEQFKQLPNANWLYGNVEQGYKQNPDFKDAKIVKEKPEGIEVIDKAKILYEDDFNISVLFPSMTLDKQTKETTAIFLEGLEQKIKDKSQLKNLVIIAHENLFKGTSPKQFTEKMEEAGIDKYHIPFYLPNNYRRELLNLIFKVPENISVKFVYGHMHDPKEVTQKGIPFQDSIDGLGMQWGVNKTDETTGQRKTRTFDMYQLPYQSIHTIDIAGETVTIKKVDEK